MSAILKEALLGSDTSILPNNVSKSIKDYIKGYEALANKFESYHIYELLDVVNTIKLKNTKHYSTKELSVNRSKIKDNIRKRPDDKVKMITNNIISAIDSKVDETLRYYQFAYEELTPIVCVSRLRLLQIINNLKEDKAYLPPINIKNRLDIKKVKVSKHISSYAETKSLVEQVNTEISKRTSTVQVVNDAEMYSILASKNLERLEDLASPSNYDDHYIQLKQVIAKVNLTATSPITSTYKYMCEFLKFNNIPKDATITSIFEEYTLLKFTDWLNKNHIETGKIQPSTTKRVILGANRVVELLKLISPLHFDAVQLAQHITPVSGSTFVKNKVEQYKPFTYSERKSIFTAIDREIEWADKFRTPYIPVKQGEKQPLSKGLDNLQWLLDNLIQNKKSSTDFICNNWTYRGYDNSEEDTTLYNKFWSELKTFKGEDKGMHPIDVLDSLYLKTYRNINKLIFPYLLKIAQVTGLNVEAISSLKINSLVSEDAISGKPALYYFKARSGGEKSLHLPLFQCDIQHIDSNNYLTLKKCFESVIELTSVIRHLASDKDSESLFIFHLKTKSETPVIDFSSLRKNTQITAKYLNEFAEKHQIKNEDTKETLDIVVGRFRPTLVSDLIRNNACIRTISHILGHSSVKTTYQYLEVNDFEEAAKKKVYDAKIEIHHQSHNRVNRMKAKNRDVNSSTKIVTPMLTCSCKDIMNPPVWIKESNTYIKGEPCTQFNQCLSCENVLITTESLPTLFARRRDLIKITETSNVEETPYGKFVKRHIKTLDSILEKKQSDFTHEELDKAEKGSLFITPESNDPFGM